MRNSPLSLFERKQALKEDYLNLVRDLVEETYEFTARMGLRQALDGTTYSIADLQKVDLLASLAKANSNRLFLKNALTVRLKHNRHSTGFAHKLLSPSEYTELSEQFNFIQLFFRDIRIVEGFSINWDETIATQDEMVALPVISIRGCLTDSENDAKYASEVEHFYSTMVTILKNNYEHDSVGNILFRIDGYKGNLIDNSRFSFDADKHHWYFVDSCEMGIADEDNSFSSLLELNPAK